MMVWASEKQSWCLDVFKTAGFTSERVRHFESWLPEMLKSKCVNFVTFPKDYFDNGTLNGSELM